MNEEDLVRRSAEEREKLFIRYDQGREGAEIDSWEEAAIEVYHSTDRYGFIHDKRLPSKVDDHEAKKLHIELERQKKWLKMIKNWDSSSEKLHSRVFKGIPNSLRTQIWCKLLNVEVLKNGNPDVFSQMCNLARENSTDARQIDSDVNRQFREHLYYRERYSLKQQQLFRVLTAYAMYNSEVGYCQGMSGLAGVLLMYMDEENAFWALHILLTNSKYAMHGYYKEGFPKLTRFLAHHDKILNKFLPKLKKHFDRFGLDAMLYSLKWFFICFVERVPFSLCLRVWDIHLLVGERVISAMAYTILKLHKRNLLKLNDMDSIVNYIQVKLYKDFMIDNDTVIQNLEKSLEELKRAKLDNAGPVPRDEIPVRPFGVFKRPTLEQIVGRRTDTFTEKEQETNQMVVRTSEIARENAERDEIFQSNASDSVGLTEKVFNRPFKCELDCTEFCRLKKLQEKSDRERQAVCKTITLIEEMKRLKQQEEDAVKLVSCKWLPPFWWEAARIVDSQDVPEVPKTGTDYSRSQPISYARWQEEPHFFSKTVDPCVRRNELLLVGRPFCNEACNWYYEQYPPPNLVHRLKRFM